MIYVIGPQDKVPENSIIINTTTSSKDWSRGLSPMVLGPVQDWQGRKCLKLENLWQFSKVYEFHTNSKGEITPRWNLWNRRGYASKWAHRYPVGKRYKPVYSWWNNQKLDYIEARKQIYIPQYKHAVIQTQAFQELMLLYYQCQTLNTDIYLFDYDGYNHRLLGMTLEDVVNCKERKMGHAFVLLGILEKQL